MSFYDDKDYTQLHNLSDAYVIGQDKIYIETKVDFPGDDYTLFNMDLVNVFVCTVPRAYRSIMNGNESLDQVSGIGGCLSDFVDGDGLYHVITNGVVNRDYGAEIYGNDIPNIVQFSFDTFATARETIFIHVQSILELPSTTNATSRRLLVDTRGTSNQFRHFVASTNIKEAPFIEHLNTTEVTVDIGVSEEGDGDGGIDALGSDKGSAWFSMDNVIKIGLIAIAIIVLMVVCILICRYGSRRRNKSQLPMVPNYSVNEYVD